MFGFIIWGFPKIGGYLILGVLIVRILLFRVLYWGPLFSETPIQSKHERSAFFVMTGFLSSAWSAQATNAAGQQMVMLAGIPELGVTKKGVSGHLKPQTPNRIVASPDPQRSCTHIV